jgi:hypothetical protein
MPFAPPFDKITSTIYDFPCAVFQNSKYLAMLRIILSMSLQKKSKQLVQNWLCNWSCQKVVVMDI